MLLTKKEDKFVCMTRFEEKDIPKNAGFRWDQEDRCWFTKDPMVAAKLYGYADESCKSELEAISRQYDKNIEASKARDADIDIPIPQGLEFMPFQKAGIKFVLQRIGYIK
jgi:SWI/SNF-related matrix-associated actin-dependent regulator 1 of chromatin subfamily A